MMSDGYHSKCWCFYIQNFFRRLCDTKLIQLKHLDGFDSERNLYIFDSSGFNWSCEVNNIYGQLDYHCDKCGCRIDTEVVENSVYIHLDKIYLPEYGYFRICFRIYLF